MAIEKMITEEAKKNAIDLLITMTVDELSEEMNLKPTELLPRFLLSRTGKLLYKESSKLWWSGPSDIAEMFRKEINGICYVVGAGENYGFHFKPEKEDYVIAADAGLRYLEERGIRADLIVGDFDTLHYVPDGGNVLKLPAEKDDTDMFMAVKEGIKAGYAVFHIYCGTGGRIDHTIANLQMLAYLAENRMQGYLFHRDCVLTMIKDGELVFDAAASGYVSVFSHSEKSTGVYLRNLKYELHDATLTSSFPLGVSNEFIGKESRISVESGTLLICFPKDITLPYLHTKYAR